MLFGCFVQYVVDTSNRQQVAVATIQLLEILTTSSLQSSPVLIVLNKRLVLTFSFIYLFTCLTSLHSLL